MAGPRSPSGVHPVSTPIEAERAGLRIIRHSPQFDAATDGAWDLRRDLDGLLQVAHLDQVIAAILF